jgi:hypothetical protein
MPVLNAHILQGICVLTILNPGQFHPIGLENGSRTMAVSFNVAIFFAPFQAPDNG